MITVTHLDSRNYHNKLHERTIIALQRFTGYVM